MSGEAVVLVGVSSTVAGVALAAGAAYLAVRMVADMRRAEQEAARREANRIMAQTAAWQAFHRTEQRDLERMTRDREALRTALETQRLARPVAQNDDPDGDRSRGFVPEPGEGMVERIRALLQELSDRQDLAPPLRRLERQARELDLRLASGAPPSPETLRALGDTLENSTRRILQDMEREAAARGRLLERVERLLGEAIACRELAREPALIAELEQLRAHLERMLISGEVKAAGVELLENRFEGLNTRVEAEREQAAIRSALEERLHTHLASLGYRPCSDASAHGEWAIPGGERVRVAVQPGNRLAFQLVHERPVASEHPLEAPELAFLRAQEQRWCGDLHGLLRRLQKDGFAFQVQLERQSQEGSVPVVVVEDVEEWIEDEAVLDAPRRRRLT